MTENEWLACRDPNDLLGFLGGRLSERKLRLFACARSRRVWHLLTDDRSRRAVEAAELFADGRLGAEDLAAFSAEAVEFTDALGARADEVWTAWVRGAGIWASAADAYTWEVEYREAQRAWSLAWVAAWAASAPGTLRWDEEAAWVCRGAQRERVSLLAARPPHPFEGEPAALLRDLVGNPFRPVTVRPAWLTWNDGTVLRLARMIYEERAFDRMPILADALEEAGCTSGALLVHCRRGEPTAPATGPLHWPGCWALDALLGVR